MLMALIWGSNFPISQIGIINIGSTLFRSLALAISSLTLLLFFLKQIRDHIFNLSFDDYKKLIILAIPNIYIVPLLNNISLEYTSISSATFLIYTMPCLTSLLLMIIERKINYISIIATLSCLLGVLLFIQSTDFNKGEYIIIISAIFWAAGALLAQKFTLDHIPMSVSVFFQMCFSLILVNLYLLVEVYNDSIITSDMIFNLETLFSLLYIGIIGSSVVYYFWFYLIKQKNAEYTCYSTLIAPIISIIIAITFFHETLTNTQLSGGLLILFSSFLITLIKPMFNKGDD